MPASKKEAKEFVKRWQKRLAAIPAGSNNEQQDTQKFWVDLLINVLGIPSNTIDSFVDFERKVRGRRIDVFVSDHNFLCEQKSWGIDLDKPEPRNGGMETPLQQAMWYARHLPYSERPRWVMTCNFGTFRLYDLENERPEDTVQEFSLEELQDSLYLLSFLTSNETSRLHKEQQLSIEAGASTEKDSRYVPDVSEAFAANHDNKLSAYRRAFIKRLNEANAKKGEPELDDDGEDAVESGLNALLGLERYLLPTLEISESADEETVSDIFVRVNSQGQALKQDDFIMTLLSVYEPAMRERIEEFCAMSHAPAKGTSYNPLMTVSPTHIIRATVGVGFKRGRLRYAYQILRGRDLKTKETTPETRAENFATFGRALDLVLDLNNWHAFINTLAEAGYVCSDQVGSGNALMFCYAFYLIGRYEFDMEPLAVRGLVRRWYFAAAITGLYVGSFESEFEQQLNDVSRLETADEFRAYFDRRLAAIMTDDYFSITLPSSLDANEATGPTWWGFVAAQVVLGAKALFSTAPLSQLLLTGSSGSKKALDKHHLFPDNYLKAKGYLSQRSNRGNFTLVDYQNNIYISDDAPNEYVRRYRAALGEDEYRRNCEEHALPVGFEDLDYEEFLGKRRQLMGELVKGAYERL